MSAPIEAALQRLGPHIVEVVGEARKLRDRGDHAQARALLGRFQSESTADIGAITAAWHAADDAADSAPDGAAATARCYLEAISVELALCWYKDPRLAPHRALSTAAGLLKPYLRRSTDPETLSVAGAIEKRLWDADVRLEHLVAAATLYGRAHELDCASDQAHLPSLEKLRTEWNRGYPGINAAYMQDYLAHLELVGEGTSSGMTSTQERRDSAKAGFARADAIRRDVLRILPEQTAQGILSQRDRGSAESTYFQLVTVAEVHFGLGEAAAARPLLAAAREQLSAEGVRAKSGWKIETTARQLVNIRRFRSQPEGEAHFPPETSALLLKTLREALGGGVDALESAVRGRLGLALSGGGFRASFFHIGVLARLAEQGLLRHVECLSCVSGGSIVGAHYYLELRALLGKNPTPSDGEYVALVERLATRFLGGVQKNLRMRVLLNAWANFQMLQGKESRTNRLGELYERFLYQTIGEPAVDAPPRPLNELAIAPGGVPADPKTGNWARTHKVPTLVLNAASLNTGHAWLFRTDGMGEPAYRFDEDIDVNDRFEFRPYDAFPTPSFPLGTAVGASSCVPGIFEPVSLKGYFADSTVRLVDGGVYDNQGAQALLEDGCDLLIVSDASGQMSKDSEPPDGAIGVALRSNSVLQARVREALYLDLESRRRGRLLRGFSFLHLKRGIEPLVIPPAPAQVPRRKDDVTKYGVSVDVQEKLAAIRTDLDAFSEVEACMLMTSGYQMAQQYLPLDSAALAGTTAGPKGSFSFLRAAKLMTARKGGSSGEEQVLRLLEIASKTFGKAILATPRLMHVAVVLGVLAAGTVAAAVWIFRETTIFNLTLGGLVGTLAPILLGLALPAFAIAHEWIQNARRPSRLLFRPLAAIAGSAAALGALGLDYFYLRAGRLDPLLEGLPAPGTPPGGALVTGQQVAALVVPVTAPPSPVTGGGTTT